MLSPSRLGRGGGATSISVTAKTLMMDSLDLVAAVLSTFFAALIDMGLQSLRRLKPTTTAMRVLELTAIASDKKAVQPQSAAGFKSRNREGLLHGKMENKEGVLGENMKHKADSNNNS